MSVASFALAVLLAQGYAPPREGTAPLDEAREERVMKLGKQLRCPVCQGLSIADSPSSTARAQLDKVRELVAQGKSDKEIYDFFIARYGEWVLLKPSTSGPTLWLWALPVLLLIGGVLVIFSQVNRRAAAAASSPLAATTDDLVAKVRADLEKP